MKELRYNFCSMLLRVEFYAGCLVMFGIQLFHFGYILLYYKQNGFSLDTVYPAAYQTSLLSNTLAFGIMSILIIPVFASVLYSDSDFVERNNHVNIYLQTRIDPYKNWRAKSILCFGVVFVMTFLSFALNALLCYLVFDHGTYSDILGSGVYERITYPFLYLESLRLSNIWLYVLICMVQVSFYIAMYALLALQISRWVKSRVYIYFIVPVAMLCLDAALGMLNLNPYSVITQMQFPAVMTVQSLIVTSLLLVGLCLVTYLYNQKVWKP